MINSIKAYTTSTMTKHTLLVIWQIQNVFNTSKNKSSSLVLKPCKFVQEISEERLFIKAGQIPNKQLSIELNSCSTDTIYYLTNTIYQARQLLDRYYLSRITKSKFSDLIFGPYLCICVEFLFSQSQTYIRLILKVVTQKNTRRTQAKGD